MGMKTRRDFLELGALAAFGAAAGCRTASGRQPLAVNGIRIGVQMWSVNDGRMILPLRSAD